MTSRWWFYPALIAVSLTLVAAGVGALTVVLLWPNLPGLDVLTNYRPKIPLRVYSADGEMIGEFGEEKRALVRLSEVPQVMKQAILAAEDDRFYQHGGVDYVGVARAAVANLQGRREGASTITMQVARTFFLTREKTFARKLSEVLLAFKIEANLTKDQILELYINQIFLGQRAYGFGSAANVYFGKGLAELSEKLVREVERLTSTRDAVSLETKELERLHKIDIAATALDQLIEEHMTATQSAFHVL
jgi:penicillin-binding protein 1A